MEAKPRGNPALIKGMVSLNPSGRPKGIQNKTAIAIKELFATILEGEQDNFKNALETLRVNNPSEYIKVLMGLSKRFLPELTATSISNADGTNIEAIQIILPQPPSQQD